MGRTRICIPIFQQQFWTADHWLSTGERDKETERKRESERKDCRILIYAKLTSIHLIMFFMYFQASVDQGDQRDARLGYIRRGSQLAVQVTQTRMKSVPVSRKPTETQRRCSICQQQNTEDATPDVSLWKEVISKPVFFLQHGYLVFASLYTHLAFDGLQTFTQQFKTLSYVF